MKFLLYTVELRVSFVQILSVLCLKILCLTKKKMKTTQFVA